MSFVVDAIVGVFSVIFRTYSSQKSIVKNKSDLYTKIETYIYGYGCEFNAILDLSI